MEYKKIMEELRKTPKYKELVEDVREMYWKRKHLLESEDFRMYNTYSPGDADTEMRILQERTSEVFWDWLRKRCEYPFDAITVYNDAISGVYGRALSAIDTAIAEKKANDISGLDSLKGIFTKKQEEKNNGKSIRKHPHSVADEPSCEPVESEQLSSSGGCKQPLESVQSQ